MIVDINGNEWIVRFKGKKVTFRTFRPFSKLIEKVKSAGEATLHFELASVQEIDPSAMGMFLQLFHAINPEQHRIKFLNASPAIEQQLNTLFALVDPKQDLNAIVASHKEQPKQLFNKVLRARSIKIRRQSEQEERLLAQTTPTQPMDVELQKKRMASFMKFQPTQAQEDH